MNSTPWVGLALCLTAVGCQLPISRRQLSPPLSPVSHSEEVDCSGIPGQAATASVPATPRLPYGFRWNDYQGADIEHDIYGDQQVCSTPHSVPHNHKSPGIIRGFGGLFAAPCRTCVAPRSAIRPVTTPTVCGDEQHSAIPLSPPSVPTPLQVAPPITAEEPVPAEPARVEPTPAEPAPAGPTLSEPTPAEKTATETTPRQSAIETPTPADPTFLPPRNVVPKTALPQAESKEAPSLPQRAQPSAAQPTSSIRLVPAQILPAAPPPGLPVPRNELRQNTIPVNPSNGSTNREKGNFGSFLYEMLLSPQ